MAKVEEHMKELFEKTDKNEKGLADSLDILERKAILRSFCSLFVCADFVRRLLSYS